MNKQTSGPVPALAISVVVVAALATLLCEGGWMLRQGALGCAASSSGPSLWPLTQMPWPTVRRPAESYLGWIGVRRNHAGGRSGTDR
jgi:hypothetical protein